MSWSFKLQVFYQKHFHQPIRRKGSLVGENIYYSFKKEDYKNANILLSPTVPQKKSRVRRADSGG